MSYNVRLVANAQRDLISIEHYYDGAAPHETERCLDAIETALEWVARYAHRPPETRFGLRRVGTAGFPYHVWYRLFERERYVQVLAVLHHRRGDDALAERIP
ncbi:type II toxin-antitoxin system RelE/ParE family toxin [Salana multivorans]